MLLIARPLSPVYILFVRLVTIDLRVMPVGQPRGGKAEHMGDFYEIY
jgi:hypothetical protein